MQANQPEWTEGPADAPYDDDYGVARVSFVHEQPRASRKGFVLTLALVASLASVLALAARSTPAPLAAPAKAAADTAAGALPAARPVAGRPALSGR